MSIRQNTEKIVFLLTFMLCLCGFAFAQEINVDVNTPLNGRAHEVPAEFTDGTLILRNTGSVYFDKINLNQNEGELNFKLRMDFDPAVKNERTKSVLRNQMFVIIARPDRSRFIIYSTLDTICVGTFDAAGKIVVLGATKEILDQGIWYDISCRWGKNLELDIDGKNVITKPFKGMFGENSTVQPTSLRIGQGKGFGIENEFSIKDIEFKQLTVKTVENKTSIKDNFTVTSKGRKKITSGDGCLVDPADSERLTDGNNAVVLTKNGLITYDKIKLNESSGELNMRLRFDFDSKQASSRTKSVLRNQIFLKIKRPDGFYAILYSTLDCLRFGVFKPSGESVFLSGVVMTMDKGRWYDIKVSWGEKIELSVDGKSFVTKDYKGLFGNLLQSDGVTISIGCPAGYGLENEFSIDTFEIKSNYSSENPKIAIPKVSESVPVIDGKLDEVFWEKCSLISGFFKYGKKELAKELSQVAIGYNEKGLYIGFNSELPNGRDPISTLTERDAGLYLEDAFELRFYNDNVIYIFTVSPNGTIYDCKLEGAAMNSSYNPEWKVATSYSNGKWTAEIFIPFQAIGLNSMPVANTTIKSNFSTDVGGWANGACWSFAPKSYNAIETFGTIVFSGSSQGMRLTLNGLIAGQPQISFKKTGELNPVTQLAGSVFDERGTEVSTYAFRLTDGNSGTYNGGNLGPGVHTLNLSAENSDGMTLLNQKLYFNTEVNTNMNVENYPYRGFASIVANFPAKINGETPAKVEFILLDKAGNIISQATGNMAQPTQAAGEIKTNLLIAGDYNLLSKIYDAKGKIIDEAKSNLTIYPKPVWWKSTVGIDHTVPPPWSPIQKCVNGFAVWNRDYLFSNGTFPKQIKIGEVDLFVGSPKFTLVTADGKIDLIKIPSSNEDLHDDQVVLQSQDKDIKLTGKLEFDGCFRFDLISSGSLTIKELTLELPLSKKFSDWMVFGNAQSSSAVILDKNFQLGFTPYMWIGSADAGLAVFFESDEFWTHDNSNAVEIIKSANGVNLKYNIITKGKTFKKPLNLTLGVMATPVKKAVTNDPFLFSRWETLPQIARPSSIIYQRLGNFTPNTGTIEFFFKRNSAAKKPYSELFAIASSNNRREMLKCYLNAGNAIVLSYNNTILISSRTTLAMDKWTHFALTVDDKELKLFLNGQKIASCATSDNVLRLYNGLANEDSTLEIGGYEQQISQCDLTIDDVRLSKVARYNDNFTVSEGELNADGNTMALDHFEETFSPDGFTGYTKAKGCPTIGSVFTEGKYGKGLMLISETVRDGFKARKEEMKHEIDLYWNWHNDFGYNREYQWPPTFSYEVRPTLKSDIEKSLAQGNTVMTYTAFPAIGVQSKLDDQFGAEWRIVPAQTIPYGMPAGHKFNLISLAAPGYADYMAYSIKWMLENYGVTAIYTDGICGPTFTANPAYGAGYTDDKGRRKGTYPFFGTRETLKRFYKIIKADSPDNVLINHQSFSLPIPIVSFSDAVFTGEHEDYSNVATGALRFRGEPWGIYMFLLGSSDHSWSEMHNMTGLLNGSAIYGYSMTGRKDMARKVKRIKDIYANNDYRNAQWYPWFKAEKHLFTLDNANIHAAAYLHHGKSALILIGNYNDTPIDAKVNLNLNNFGMTGKKITVTNELLKIPVEISGNIVTLPLLPMNFTLIKIDAK